MKTLLSHSVLLALLTMFTGCGGNEAVTLDNLEKAIAVSRSNLPHSIKDLEKILGKGEEVEVDEYREIVKHAPPDSQDLQFWIWYGKGDDYIAAIYSHDRKELLEVTGTVETSK